MLKHNLFSSFRNIRRNLSFSLINIAGLSLGLSLVIILLAWLQFEFSFDKFHVNAGRIFRVVVDFREGTALDKYAHTPSPLGDALKNEIPEVVDYVRFGSLGRMLVSKDNSQFWEDIELADPSVFRIFTFRFLSGDPERALTNPRSVVLTRRRARRYFGDADPVGQTLLMGEERSPYLVTGVMEDIPANSQLRFDMLASFAELKNNLSWGAWNYTTYILAGKENSFRAINNKLPGITGKYSKENDFQLHIQPLTSIHLHSQLRSDLPTNRNIKTVYIISSILVLVLLIACINYMNLTTARYTKRGKEAGIRKVTGATNSNLVGLFLGESFAITVISFILALFLIYLFAPIFSSLTGSHLNLKSLFTFGFFSKVILLIASVSVLAGSYPAFVLSGVNPVLSLKDDHKPGNLLSIKGLRKGLVILQFFISTGLIACTLVIRSQMSFIKNKDLGLSPDQVVVIPIYNAQIRPKYELFKKEILSNPRILSASAVGYIPGRQNYFQNVWWEGMQDTDYSKMMSWLPVDKDFIKTLKIKLIEGNDFPENMTSDGPKSYILNESAVSTIGWKDPVGKQFSIIGKGKIIGVVRDFNFKSLHSGIEPVALAFHPHVFDNMMIRISSQDIAGNLNFLRKKWESLFPSATFEFAFLSDDFRNMYEKEVMTLRIITYVSVLSLLISCIGLFGLVLFTLDHRIKEIGIRKVSGSTTGEILVMLNMEFLRWIIISFLFSCPLIIYFMDNWLENFAYRISLNWPVFAISGLITLTVSLLTVSWHTWRMAGRNPVECLRYE